MTQERGGRSSCPVMPEMSRNALCCPLLGQYESAKIAPRWPSTERESMESHCWLLATSNQSKALNPALVLIRPCQFV